MTQATITRADWSAERPDCWLCGKPANQTHEIARGASKQAAMEEPAAWVRTCQRCHDDLGGYGKWPIDRQLALKRLMDPKHYSRTTVNRLRYREREAITHQEVLAQVPYVVIAQVRNGVPLERIEELLKERDGQC